jgi:hypothetical protein
MRRGRIRRRMFRPAPEQNDVSLLYSNHLFLLFTKANNILIIFCINVLFPLPPLESVELTLLWTFGFAMAFCNRLRRCG